VTILGYPLATVLAEKLCTAVDLGAGNSRVRDYADIWTLTGRHDLTAEELHQALHATAAHRGVTLRPLSTAIGDTYATARSGAYTAYRRRLSPDTDTLPEHFASLLTDVLTFADPLLLDQTPPPTRWACATRTWTPTDPSPST